jgi:hypothetical protein
MSLSFNLVTQSNNGLMSSVDKIKLDKFKFVGWVDIPAVNGTTPSVGSSYLFGGAITGAIRLNNTDTVVQITFPNMGTNNYYLKFTVESTGGSLGDIKSDNNVTHPVFRKVSQTQAVISIDKFIAFDYKEFLHRSTCIHYESAESQKLIMQSENNAYIVITTSTFSSPGYAKQINTNIFHNDISRSNCSAAIWL